MLFKAVEIVILVLVFFFLWSQVIWPALKGTQVFPMFDRKRKTAEERLREEVRLDELRRMEAQAELKRQARASARARQRKNARTKQNAGDLKQMKLPSKLETYM